MSIVARFACKGSFFFENIIIFMEKVHVFHNISYLCSQLAIQIIT